MNVDKKSWMALAGTGGGYLLILVVLFVVLFVVPYVIFSAV